MDDQNISKEQIVAMLVDGFNQTPFHQTLGLTFKCFDDDSVVAHFSQEQGLMGNVARKMVHGGVLSGVFDALGGVVCSIALIDKYKHLGISKGTRKLNRLCTIDLKIDFIAPAKGKQFEAVGNIVNLGSSVILVDMHMHDDNKKLIAKASATYMY